MKIKFNNFYIRKIILSKTTVANALLRAALVCTLLLPAVVTANAPESPATSGWKTLSDFLGLSAKRDAFLDPERAFVLTVNLSNDTGDNNGITAHWDIARGYYLYRDKFQFRILSPNSIKPALPVSPAGKKKYDEYFGEMEVYYRQLDIQLPLLYKSQKAITAQLEISYQGCADAGFCYPPISKTIELLLPARPAP